jgi:hypothetical protein
MASNGRLHPEKLNRFDNIWAPHNSPLRCLNRHGGKKDVRDIRCPGPIDSGQLKGSVLQERLALLKTDMQLPEPLPQLDQSLKRNPRELSTVDIAFIQRTH